MSLIRNKIWTSGMCQQPSEAITLVQIPAVDSFPFVDHYGSCSQAQFLAKNEASYSPALCCCGGCENSGIKMICDPVGVAFEL